MAEEAVTGTMTSAWCPLCRTDIPVDVGSLTSADQDKYAVAEAKRDAVDVHTRSIHL